MGLNPTANQAIINLSKFSVDLHASIGRSVIAEEKDYDLIFEAIQDIKTGSMQELGRFDLTQKPYYKLWKDIDGSYADARPLNFRYALTDSMDELLNDYVVYGADVAASNAEARQIVHRESAIRDQKEEQRIAEIAEKNAAKFDGPQPQMFHFGPDGFGPVKADLGKKFAEGVNKASERITPKNMKTAIEELVEEGMSALHDIPQTQAAMTAKYGPTPVPKETVTESIKRRVKPMKVTDQQVEMYKQMQEQEAIRSKVSDVFVKSSTKAYISRGPSAENQHEAIIISIAAPGFHKSDIKITKPMGDIIEVKASKKQPIDWAHAPLTGEDANGNNYKFANHFATDAIQVENPLNVELFLSADIDADATDFLLDNGVLTIYLKKKAKRIFTVK
jgi:HSP20 family molecular chaperone IbpA